MIIVFQVHRRTTSLAPFEKVILHKLQIQVSLPLLKLNKSIPLYKEKGKLIHISAMANFNLGKISFKRISLLEWYFIVVNPYHVQVHRRTTSLAPFEKVILHKLQIQVSLPLVKRNKSIPLYKEKGN